eukprot:403355170
MLETEQTCNQTQTLNSQNSSTDSEANTILNKNTEMNNELNIMKARSMSTKCHSPHTEEVQDDVSHNLVSTASSTNTTNKNQDSFQLIGKRNINGVFVDELRKEIMMKNNSQTAMKLMSSLGHSLSPNELQNLINHNQSVTEDSLEGEDDDDSCENENSQVKRQKRLIQNRKSAKKCRLKKKDEHNRMKKEISLLIQENRILKHQLIELSNQFQIKQNDSATLQAQYEQVHNQNIKTLQNCLLPKSDKNAGPKIQTLSSGFADPVSSTCINSQMNYSNLQHEQNYFPKCIGTMGNYQQSSPTQASIITKQPTNLLGKTPLQNLTPTSMPKPNLTQFLSSLKGGIIQSQNQINCNQNPSELIRFDQTSQVTNHFNKGQQIIGSHNQIQPLPSINSLLNSGLTTSQCPQQQQVSLMLQASNLNKPQFQVFPNQLSITLELLIIFEQLSINFPK